MIGGTEIIEPDGRRLFADYGILTRAKRRLYRDMCYMVIDCQLIGNAILLQ